MSTNVIGETEYVQTRPAYSHFYLPHDKKSKNDEPYEIQYNAALYVHKQQTYEKICKMCGSKQKLDNWSNGTINIVIVASLLVAVFSTSACFVFLSFPEPFSFIFGILLIAPMSACLMRIIHWNFNMGS